MRRKTARSQLARDIIYILLGACLAIVLVRTGALDSLLNLLGNGAIAAFIVGIFFTSAFTIAPSSVAIAHMAQSTPMGTIVLWGALGALCGDLILFFFIRDRFSEDLRNSLKPSFIKHVMRSFHLGFLKWLAPLVGAVIIASPLPDELGLALMGLSRTKLAVLIPVSFVMNAFGVYLLARLAISV